MTSTGCTKVKTSLTADADFDVKNIITLAEFESADTDKVAKSISVFND